MFNRTSHRRYNLIHPKSLLALNHNKILFSVILGGYMVVAERLKTLREAKNLSQGDIETRTGLLRCYVSRVENGHAGPSVETLEKFARALEVPIYQLFYDGDKSPTLPIIPKRKHADETAWGSTGKDVRWLYKFRRLLARTGESDRKILMFTAQEMARRKAV